jgi:hypothetical protein
MKYYALISGLPDITIDDVKLPFSVLELKKELSDILSSKDKKLINSILLKYDNDNLLNYLKSKDAVLNNNGTISSEDLTDMVLEIKEVENPLNKNMPIYFKKFVNDYIEGVEALDKLFWEDHLANLYYEFLLNSDNKFVRDWAELNLNINNSLIALSARRNEKEYIPYIIGKNEIAETIRTSNARDLGLGELFEQYEEIRRIDEETNIIEREKKIDQLRWNWIEEKNFFNYFTIEKIIGFLLKLQMTERWTSLNEEKGKQIFHNLVNDMRKSVISDVKL